jgi:Amt family ammonium transporter
MEDVLASLSEAVVVERDQRVVFANAAFERLFGYKAEEVLGGTLRDFIVPESHLIECAQVERKLLQGGVASLETERKRKDGVLVEVALEARPLIMDGKIDGLTFTYREIGEHKRIEAKLQHDALHDSLTGLPNRVLFLDRMNLAFSRRSRNRGENFGVLFLDLDRFKEVNDTLGHATGDALLIAAAGRLRFALREQDTTARLGGDEFAILAENILSSIDIEHMAGRVLQAMERAFEINGHTVHVGASIGVAIAGPDHTAPEQLIRDADFAMYRAKQAGGGRIEIFDKKLEIAAAYLQECELGLRQVIKQHQFELQYQPICRLKAGALLSARVEGFDAQLCWRRVDGSVADIGSLLPIAEETGLSISLGRETLEGVCKQLKNWADGLPQSELTLAIHLTRRQFYHSNLIALVKRTLTGSGADPARLLFEVGESTLSENPKRALDRFERLLECNVRLGVDDFGSALAPLNYLESLPVDVVKLTPRLTLIATQTGRQVAVLESLIQLGLKLGVQVVAQGIDSVEQAEALARMGCEWGQGPLLSPALEPAEAQKLAERGNWVLAGEVRTGLRVESKLKANERSSV